MISSEVAKRDVTSFGSSMVPITVVPGAVVRVVKAAVVDDNCCWVSSELLLTDAITVSLRSGVDEATAAAGAELASLQPFSTPSFATVDRFTAGLRPLLKKNANFGIISY